MLTNVESTSTVEIQDDSPTLKFPRFPLGDQTMSLLFGSGEQILPVEFSIPAGHSDGVVAVSQSVWDALGETVDYAPERDVDKLAVIIEPASGSYITASSGLYSLVEWAILDDSVRESRCHREAKLFIPFLPGRWGSFAWPLENRISMAIS